MAAVHPSRSDHTRHLLSHGTLEHADYQPHSSKIDFPTAWGEKDSSSGRATPLTEFVTCQNTANGVKMRPTAFPHARLILSARKTPGADQTALTVWHIRAATTRHFRNRPVHPSTARPDTDGVWSRSRREALADPLRTQQRLRPGRTNTPSYTHCRDAGNPV